MSKHARDRRPYIKPVTRLELSEANIKYRWIAIAVLLAGAVQNIFYGLYCILDYRIPYQIIDMRKYGQLTSINGVVGGVLMAEGHILAMEYVEGSRVQKKSVWAGLFK